MHLVDPADTFLLPGPVVINHDAFLEFTGVNTNIGQASHKRIGGNLEDQSGQSLIIFGLSGDLLFGPGINSLYSTNIDGTGKQVANGIQHTLNPFIFKG